MPHFYFDVLGQPDEYGTDLPSIANARHYAMRYAADLIRDIDVGSRGPEYWRLDVRQDQQEPAFSIVVELLPIAQTASVQPLVEQAAAPDFVPLRRWARERP